MKSINDKFFTFEGIDGSGKDTQIKLLGKHLKSSGIDFIVTSSLGGTKLGEIIRKYLIENMDYQL